jgi:DNA invertase Pin-like site-specific DNA recombinase
MKTKIAIYGRVSSIEQDYERQINELTQYAAAMNYEIVGTFSEKISGAKKSDERPELSKVMNLVKEQKINKILIWEFSRFSRNTLDLLNLIDVLNENCVSLFVKKDSFETLDENCEMTAFGKMMLTILGAVSEMERTTIKQRLDSGYNSHRAKGGRVGRRPGYEKDIEKTKKFNEISSLLKQGYSIRATMNMLNVSQITVYKIKKHLEETKQLTNSLKIRMRYKTTK